MKKYLLLLSAGFILLSANVSLAGGSREGNGYGYGYGYDRGDYDYEYRDFRPTGYLGGPLPPPRPSYIYSNPPTTYAFGRNYNYYNICRPRYIPSDNRVYPYDYMVEPSAGCL